MAGPVETPIGTVTAEHFRPGHVRHQVVVGPKFLYALFNPRDRMYAVSRAFVEFVRDGDLPYRRLVVNDHIVDEAATRLKKQASMRNAATFLTTLTGVISIGSKSSPRPSSSRPPSGSSSGATWERRSPTSSSPPTWAS